MKETGVNFNSENVIALLSGRKTMTRRPVKNVKQLLIQDYEGIPYTEDVYGKNHKLIEYAPYGKVGDRIYVRETFMPAFGPEIYEYPNDWRFKPWNENLYGKMSPKRFPTNEELKGLYLFYKADGNLPEELKNQGIKWKPAILMPKWAARIWQEITEIKAEKIQDITEEDAIAEGVLISNGLERGVKGLAVARFADLWDSIYKNSNFCWDKNPWVWVYKFKRISI